MFFKIWIPTSTSVYACNSHPRDGIRNSTAQVSQNFVVESLELHWAFRATLGDAGKTCPLFRTLGIPQSAKFQLLSMYSLQTAYQKL